jgi:hypothetical protein
MESWTLYNLAKWIWVNVIGGSTSTDAEWELDLLRQQHRDTSKYVKLGNNNVCVVQQPFKPFKQHIELGWTRVIDMFGQDVTQVIELFATEKHHFFWTAIKPEDMLYYETDLTFFSATEEWVVPVGVPVLEVLRVSST